MFLAYFPTKPAFALCSVACVSEGDQTWSPPLVKSGWELVNPYWTSPASWYTEDAAIEAGEEKSPSSAMIEESSTNFCAIRTVCFGSDWEASHLGATCLPSIPPSALTLSSARSRPC